MHLGIGPLLGGGALRKQLLSGGAGSVGLKIANVGLGMALGVVLARTLGPAEYGIYVYVYALMSLLAIPAEFGLPALVIRETARAEADQQWGLIRGIWRWAGLTATGLAFALAVIGAVFAWLFSDHFSTSQLATFGWSLALLPLIVLGNLRGAALIGLRKTVRGQLPEQFVRPVLLIGLIAAAGLFTRGEITSDQAMALHTFAAAIAFVFGVWLLWRERSASAATRSTLVYRIKPWFASTLPLALIAGMSLINTNIDLVMLGFFVTPSEVGVYRVAAVGAALVSLGLTAIGMVTMPHFAHFHAKGDMVRFQSLATASARASLLLALPAAITLLLFGSSILRLVFGPGYDSGYLVLAILTCAQLVHAGFGTISPLLNMTGYERDTAKGVAIAAVCNVILNVAMIPLLGTTGAALATAITLIVWNVVLWRMVRRRLGVDSSVLGSFQKRWGNSTTPYRS